MDIIKKVKSVMAWIFNLADKQENSRKTTIKKINGNFKLLAKSFAMILAGIIGLIKSALKLILNLVILGARIIGMALTMIVPIAIFFGLFAMTVVGLKYVTVWLLKVTWFALHWLVIDVLWQFILWFGTFFVQNHEVILLILTGIAILLLITLALYKLGQKYLKALFWTWLILSLARIALFFWLDWEFFSRLSLYLLGIFGLGVLIFWLASKDWKKIKEIALPFSWRALLSAIGAAILSLIFFGLIAFLFSLRSCEAEKPAAFETIIEKEIVETTKKDVESTIEFLTATDGMSVWGILNDCNVEQDSLLSKSIDFSQKNKLKMFILTKNNERISVTNESKKTIIKNYGKIGKKLVAILPVNSELSWNYNSEELKVIK